MKTRTRILVVGGGYAGLLCALRLARRAGDASVVLVEARPWFVERVRLHEDVVGPAPRRRRALAELVDGSGVALRTGRVSAVDLERRRARIEKDSGGAHDEAFDELVLATGSVAKAGVGVPGIEHALRCDTEESALRLRAQLADVTRGNRNVTNSNTFVTNGNIVVVGGGLTGLELAAELGTRARGNTHVSLVSAGALGDGNLAEDARAFARGALAAGGVALIERDRVAAIDADAVVLASGARLRSDATIWAGGLEPSPLARAIGLAVDGAGRAVVDERLRSTSHAFVHVAGDAARAEVGGQVLRMACATAMPMGAFCADDLARAIARRPARPFRFSYLLQCASIGRDAGLVQKVDTRDTPTTRWLGGRPAAWFKEFLCRYTMASMHLERRGWGYVWPRAPMPALARAGAAAAAAEAARGS